jgi:hypothetical protein
MVDHHRALSLHEALPCLKVANCADSGIADCKAAAEGVSKSSRAYGIRLFSSLLEGLCIRSKCVERRFSSLQ